MKFEGTVKIDAPRHEIWAALTNPDLLVQITPGVLSAETITPNSEFLLQTGLQVGTQTISNPVALRWVTVRPRDTLAFIACITLAQESFEMTGEMVLREDGVVFSAEVPSTPRHIPRPLLHQITAQTIRSFFKNLKTTLESTSLGLSLHSGKSVG